MKFFDRFRGALLRYARGVHDLGEPASPQSIAKAEHALGRKLPVSFRDFLAQWNGGWLFHDDYAITGVEGARDELRDLAIDDDLVRFGRSLAATLFFDERGRVIARDLDTEERAVEGSDFERWLDATMAREAVVYDREGEFREEAFHGGELAAAARKKRAQSAAKADPASPAWQAELGLLDAEEGHDDRALAAFRRAVALDPALASAHFAAAKLLRADSAHADAARAFAAAGASYREAAEAAFAFAHAARAAADAAIPEAAAFAARAAALEPGFVAEQRAAASHLIADGALDEAMEHLALAAAVAPDDESLQSALAHLRARRSLRQV